MLPLNGKTEVPQDAGETEKPSESSVGFERTYLEDLKLQDIIDEIVERSSPLFRKEK